MDYSWAFNKLGEGGTSQKLIQNFEKSAIKKQHGSKMNYLRIFLFEYVSTIFGKVFGLK